MHPEAEGRAMSQRQIMPALICLLLLPALAANLLLAKGDKDSVWIGERKDFRVVHEDAAFDILQSTQFFNGKCLTAIDCINFPLAGSQVNKSIAPDPDRRNLEEKIADTFKLVTAYPGGNFLYNTMLAGLDLMSYSQKKTSFSYRDFKFGPQFGGAGRGFLKTGIFYNF
jgi:hypothetical protein